MGSGILGLIGNYVNARHERQAKKDQEALERYYEAAASIENPNIGKFMANAQQDVHAALADLIGDKEYKEHQPFVQRALEGVGNAVIGSFSGTMPMWGQHVPRIPTAGAPPGGAGGAPQDLPTLQRGTSPSQPVPGPGQMIQEDPNNPGQTILVPHDPFGTGRGQPGQGAPSQAVQPGAADTSQVFPGVAPGVQGIPDAVRERIAGQLATLAGQAQQAQAPPGPLPGGSTPASTLAPGGPAGGATPGTLIGPPGKGGFYGLPQESKDVGRAEFLRHQGVFGKTPQEIQGIVDVYHQEVQAGRMTSQDAIAAIQKAIQANVDPSTRAGAAGGGTYTERWFQPPDTKDEKGNVVHPKPVALMENSRNPNELYNPNTGEYLTGKQVGGLGYQRIRTPSAAAAKVMDADPAEPEVQKYLEENYPNFDPKKLPPGQILQIRQDANGNWVGEPHFKPMNPNQRESMRMADVKSFQAGVEKQNPDGTWRPVTPQESEELGDLKYRQWRDASISRILQGEDINAWKTGKPAQDFQMPAGYRDKPGYVEQPQGGQDAQGAGDAAGARMQGLPGGQPGASQTPNVVPGNLPAGPQPAAAGSPGAAPSASVPPQAPATHPPTVQPVTPPAAQTPPAAAQAPQGRGVAPDSVYIGAYMSSLDPSQTGPRPIESMVTVGRQKVTQLIADMIQRDEGRTPTAAEVAARIGTAENEWGAQMGAQRLNSQKAVAIEGLVDNIDKFARQFIYQSRQIPDHGSLLANSFQRDIVSKFQTNPKLASYKALGLGLGSTWGQMVSTAINSNAQLDSGALKATLEKISTNAPRQEIAETMSRILLEGDTENWRYKDVAYKIEQNKTKTLLGKISNYGATIGDPPAEPHYAPPPADGTIRKVRGTNQFVHYDAIKRRYVAGAQ